MKKTIKIVVMALLCLNFWAVAQTIPIKLSGTVRDKAGKPIPGATIKASEKERTTFTDKEGKFSLTIDKADGILTISGVGYQTANIPFGPKFSFEVTLHESAGSLDDVVVIAYGTTTKRLNTGSTAKISSEEISRQPVSNPLQALYGRVPGLVVTSTGGLPGAAVKVQLRGRTSINSTISNDPLFIIDGIPFAANNSDMSIIGRNAAGSVSPFNSINPEDIERIDILKDADATSIYGSRGSNGVILIQTKKGKAGRTKVDANINYGWSSITRSSDWMNTKDYVSMRKEAFRNDNVAMTNANAYDILVWDTTRYTDLKKLLLNKTSHSTNANLLVSGGSAETQFLISGSYSRQGAIIPVDFGNNRGSVLFNIGHSSKDKRFDITLSGNFVATKNNLTSSDLSGYLNFPPNLPSLYDENGRLNWSFGGYSFNNPLAYLQRTYLGTTKNLISNLQTSYKLTDDLKFRTSLGYNLLLSSEESRVPISSLDPSTNPTGSSAFSDASYSSVIIEPQLDYSRSLGDFKLNVLLGGSYQVNGNKVSSIIATGYTNDLLLGSPSAASTTVSSSAADYKYAAVFSRINLNFKDTYILNLTGRRDGSSRFGPNRRFSNFGALGAAYVFSAAPLVARTLPFLSFGKLRASYGLTGNDKIGDYAYLNTYSPRTTSFQGVYGLYPTGLPNADYVWELNKKLEIAIELGFLKNRLSLNLSYYNNRSGNQLLSFALPAQTGGTSIIANFPAKVENSGLEFEIGSTNFSNGKFKWTTSINLTIPKNRLIGFENLSASSYNYLIIGQPLSIIYGFVFAGINASTGLPEFRKADGSLTSSPVFSADKNVNLGNLDPDFYGGLSNEISYGGLTLSFLLEFKKQRGNTVIGNMYSNATYPGTMFNQPLAALNRWTPDNVGAGLPKFTATAGSAAYSAINNIRLYGSNFKLGDASYIRLKNISLAYELPKKLTAKMGIERLRFYANAQNLFVLTGYKYADPETQTLLRTGPLKIISIGIQTTF